jgi:hypothetical protein
VSAIPCQQNAELDQKIKAFAEVLKTQAHTLGKEQHGLSEHEFYNSGLFRGAIERIRGQFSATMREKREFVQNVLNYMQDRGYIGEWENAGDANRHDYSVKLNSGRVGVIELKGCLDGNNTNIFDRPPHAHEFIIWSVCTNPGADPRHNAWSGLHTRLSAEIITRGQRVDGLMVWDMVCSTIGRPCPKILTDGNEDRLTEVGAFRLPPPCIYFFPATIPSVRNNPKPSAQTLQDVELLRAFHECFKGRDEELNFVTFEVAHAGIDIVRQTTITRSGVIQKQSGMTAIQRQ